MGKITIRDVAREAGVSISLVSLVMNAKRDAEGNLDCNVNKDTARRIAEVAKRLGYRPNKAAASLRSGRFYTIGMVTSDIANQFFADIARYIENIAHNYNYTVLFGSSDENAEKLDNIVDTFIGNGVEGLIVAPCSGSEEVLRKALDAGIPTVLLDRDIAGLDVGRVMLDNERAGRMGVEHLYENGYRRIEMISYTLGISSLSERERGYCEAMRRYGLEGYSQIHYTVYGHAQEDTVRIFEDAVRRGVEAFLLPTNTLALLGLQALNALNLSAPEDLALVGFDESEIFSLYKPSVTYITQSTRRLGEQSFEMLRRMIAGDDDCRSVVIEPELIVGGSTACIHPERVEAGREHAAGVAELTPRDSVLLPGTYFRHKGGWTADPQFMEQMGSSYLLAHGLGTPVEDAVTKIEIPQSGQYRIFVRRRTGRPTGPTRRSMPPAPSASASTAATATRSSVRAIPNGIGRRAVRPTLRRASTKSRCTIWRDSTRVATPSSSRCTTWRPTIRSKRSSGCATTCSACPPNPKSGGRSISSSRAAAWPACAPPLRRHGRGCAWR